MSHELVSVDYIYINIMSIFYISYDFASVVYELASGGLYLHEKHGHVFYTSYDFLSVVYTNINYK